MDHASKSGVENGLLNGVSPPMWYDTMVCRRGFLRASKIVRMFREFFGGETGIAGLKELIEANVQKKSSYENLVGSGGLIDISKTIKALKTIGKHL